MHTTASPTSPISWPRSGNASPSSLEFDWGNARKSVCSLKTLYRFVCRQKFIELEPSIMVRFDKLIEEIDASVLAAFKQTADFNEKDVVRHKLVQMIVKAYESHSNREDDESNSH